MSKKSTTAAMTLRMNIEMADNGIIIRDPDCEDIVTLALAGKSNQNYGSDTCHADEHRVIGEKIYDWLFEVVLQEQDPNIIIPTGFQLEINAKCEGRARI